MSRRTFNLALLTILVVGVLLRYAGFVWGQGYRESNSGERDAYRVALGFLAGERPALYLAQPNFPRGGTGHLPGPLMAIFWAVPMRLGGGPETVILIMIVLDTLVIGIVSELARRMLGDVQALWAALFYATAPWAVYYSIGCWNPQFLAPLGALLCLALWNVMMRPASRQIFWVCLLLAMMPQFQAFGLFLIPPVLALLSFRWRDLNRRWLGFGLLACLALYTPYLVGDASNHWDNTRRMFSAGDKPSPACLNIFTLPVVSLSNLFNSALAADSRTFNFGTITEHISILFADYRAFGRAVFGSFAVLAAFNGLSLALGALFVINLAVQFLRALRGKWTRPRVAFETLPAIVFAGLMIFLPLLAFLLTRHQFRNRYVIPLLPILSLLPAVWIAHPLGLVRWRKIAVACLVVTIAFNIALSIGYYRFQQRLIADGPYFVPSFRQLEQVRQRLIAFAGQEQRIVVDTSSFPSVPRHTENYRQVQGMRALAEYMEIREQYQPRAPATAPVVCFAAQSATNTVPANELVVFAGNGIMLTVPRSRRG